jgi:hypothetical protein
LRKGSGEGGGANGLWEMGQNHNIGLEWRGVCILALKAITPSIVFAFESKHMNCCIVHYIILLNTVYIFLLCRLKDNQVKESQNMCVYSWACEHGSQQVYD